MKRTTLLVFVIITLGALFVRFWDYQKLLTFHLDPPFHLLEAREMVDLKKLRLIGPMVTTKIIHGRGFFTGPTYYYLLAFLGIISSWNVVFITSFFTFLWIATFVLIFFWLAKRFDDWVVLSVYALLSFYPWLVPLSRVIWNTNPVPFFAVLLFWFLQKREKRRSNYFWSGLFFGLGISFHYSALLWVLVVFYYLIVEARAKSFLISNWLFFLGGAIVGDFPFLLFEARHNFYNLGTVIFQIKNFDLSAGYNFGRDYYYILPTIPLICRLYGLILEKLKRLLNLKVIVFCQIILVSFFLFRISGGRKWGVFMPDGWTLEKQKKVANLIVEDKEPGFEVAATISSDTRFYDLRWWLKEESHEPMSVIDYDKTDILYLVAPESRPPEKETVWEVSALAPFREEKRIDLDDGIIFYKLRRLPKKG